MLVIVVTESRIQAVQSNETFTHVQKPWQEKNMYTATLHYIRSEYHFFWIRTHYIYPFQIPCELKVFRPTLVAVGPRMGQRWLMLAWRSLAYRCYQPEKMLIHSIVINMFGVFSHSKCFEPDQVSCSHTEKTPIQRHWKNMYIRISKKKSDTERKRKIDVYSLTKTGDHNWNGQLMEEKYGNLLKLKSEL